MTVYNIYCDESCHLEKDGFPVMCIGYTKVDNNIYEAYKEELKKIKTKHKVHAEIKWVSVSTSRLEFYKEVINFFFGNYITFRCILVKYKNKLDHSQFNQGDHNNFYYKLIFHLLHAAVNPPHSHYRVYLDIKDTRGKERLEKIHTILGNTYKQQSPFIYFQHIRSHENLLMQLTDLFIGAITYKNRKEHEKVNANPAKVALINYIEQKSGYLLDEGTEPWESKFNIFDHQPKAL
jgi:hypothetical protein